MNFCSQIKAKLPSFKTWRGLLWIVLALVTFSITSIGNANSCVTIFENATLIQNKNRLVQNYYEQMWKPATEQKWAVDTIGLLSKEINDILKDPRQNNEKLEAYRKLGVTIKNGQMTGPTFQEFLINYSKLLDKLGVPENERIYPALVLIKDSVDGSSNPEIRFVTPGKDPWPTEPGFRLYGNDDPFNLPLAATMKAHRAGRFPIIAVHDFGHFVGFIKNPEYMRAIRKAFTQLGPIPKGSSFYLRLAMLIETFSLGNPKSRAEMQNLLATPAVKNGAGLVPMSEFMRTMHELPESDLIAHASKLSANFENLMMDYGGAHIRPTERDGPVFQIRFDYKKEELPPLRVLNWHMGRRIQAFYAELVPGIQGTELKVILEGYAKWPIEKNLLEGILKNIYGIDWMNSAELNGSTPMDAKDLYLKLIREHTARTEYFLWNSSQIPIEKWVSTLLKSGPIDLNDPVMLILRDVFGPDSKTYQRMAADYAL